MSEKELAMENGENLPKKVLAVIHDADFGLENGDEENYDLMLSARAVLVNEWGEVGLIDASGYNYYKLPGGSIEEGESVRQALGREVVEEAGYESEVLDGLGQVIEYRKRFNTKNISYIYLCRATDLVGDGLTEFEKERGFKLEWFKDIDAAIEAVKQSDPVEFEGDNDSVYAARFYVRRELAALEEAKRVLAT